MAPKTTRNDLSVDEISLFRRLENAFLSRCRHFGYREIKTATIQPLHIFTASDALSQTRLRRIYSFIDWNGWSGERVALKPDSTTCVARFYADNCLPAARPQKYCYVENHFEWADTAEALSERWQYGIENIGIKEVHADIEAVYMACDVLREVCFKDMYLFLSYPKMVKDLAGALALDPGKEAALFEAVRRREDPGPLLKGLPPEPATALGNLLSCTGENVNYLLNFKSGLAATLQDRIGPALENFIAICRHLDAVQCAYRIDFSLLGDFEYYTGMQFQILARPERKDRRDILCAGGRYDHLIGNLCNLSESVPSVGFALYARNIIDKIPCVADHLQQIQIQIENITAANIRKGQLLCDKLAGLGFETQIGFSHLPAERYAEFGLVILVDQEIPDGYRILNSQKIGKPLLTHLFGGL